MRRHTSDDKLSYHPLMIILLRKMQPQEVKPKAKQKEMEQK